jgi:ribosome biogenesis GTPase / thiamine phosphate phosphatase
VNDSCESTSHPLAAYGWNPGVADAFAPYRAGGLLPARVIRVDRGRCDAVTPDGTVQAGFAPVTTRDPARFLTTGDWAAVGEDANGLPEVQAVLPRRTAFVRSTSSKRSEGQVLAANIDHAVIAVSMAHELDLGRLERFVSLGWASGAEPVVVLTKSDLVPDPDTLAHLVSDCRTAAPGTRVLPVSSLTGAGLDALRETVSRGTTVLLGVSGAGKSTLANTLLGEETQRVHAIRDRDGKGRHTTTTRNLLPLPDGGVLIDTPGLRGVGLWDAGEGLGQAFAEIEDLAAACRFADCEHRSEPGCAVLAALEEGALPERRLDSYRKLQRENERLAVRADARLRLAERKKLSRRDAQERYWAERKRNPRRRR